MATYTGTSGDDTYTGTDTADTINGNDGHDTLAGGAGADTINGGAGSDSIYAGALSPAWSRPYTGNFYTPPLLDRGSEVDTLNGGAGYDSIYAGYGDKVDGGADYAQLLISLQGASAGVTADFSVLNGASGVLTIGGNTIRNISSVVWIEGSEFNDTIVANGNSDAPTFGMGGDDVLSGGYYSGNFYGGDGNDTLDLRNCGYGPFAYGEAGDDIIYGATSSSIEGGDGNDTITGGWSINGGAGDDLITNVASSYSTTASGGTGNDTINGNDYENRLAGNEGADILRGNGGNDYLFAGNLNFTYGYDEPWAEADTGLEHDQLFGGDQDDWLSIGYGDDADGGTGTNTLTISLAGATSGVTLNTTSMIGGGTVSFAGGTIKNIQKIGTVFGSAHADTITIANQSTSAVVWGGDGNDVLTGGTGSETFHGGAGADTIRGGGGDDFVYFDAPADLQAGDKIDGGAGFDTLRFSDHHPAVDISGVTLTGIEAIEWPTYGYNPVSLTAAQYDGLTRAAGVFKITTGGSISLAGMTAASTLWLSAAGNQVDMSGYTGFAEVNGGDGNDVIQGSAGAETFVGAGGDDQLSGGDGADNLTGGLGADTLKGEGGDDFLRINTALEAGDSFDGGEGTDTLYFDSYSNAGGASISAV